MELYHPCLSHSTREWANFYFPAEREDVDRAQAWAEQPNMKTVLLLWVFTKSHMSEWINAVDVSLWIIKVTSLHWCKWCDTFMTEDFLQGCCIYLCVFKQLPSECVMQCNSHCRCQHLLFCSILYPKGKYLNLKLPNVSAVQHIVVVFLLLRGTVLIGAVGAELGDHSLSLSSCVSCF